MAPGTRPWTRRHYCAGVAEVRARIAAGTVYQVNLCRVLSHELPEEADLRALAALLARGNPAPHAGHIHVPSAGLDVDSASPETFLVRDGGRLESRPIKGTATRIDRMLPKDYAENVMIVDLVRNDLSQVCRPSTIRVDHQCSPEEHPGLVHLVSTVSGSCARRGIRSFWAERDERGRRWLAVGTGAGITWDSDPHGEWEDTGESRSSHRTGLWTGFRLSSEVGVRANGRLTGIDEPSTARPSSAGRRRPRQPRRGSRRCWTRGKLIHFGRPR